MNTSSTALVSQANALPCITLIGMPGAGKTTVGKALARKLNWAFIDSDHLIEAIYAAHLQDITDSLGKAAFLDVEGKIIETLRARRTVIATGGSVVYRDAAMQHLLRLGPVVHLDVPFHLLQERIARNPKRGIAINPGETLEDLFKERAQLYTRYASLCCVAHNKSPNQCATWIAEHLPQIAAM